MKRHSVSLAAHSWAEAKGLEALDTRAAASEIQLDVLRRDPWSAGAERGRFLWLRALFQLNPFLLYALFSDSPAGRPSRFYSIVKGELGGHTSRLCHFSSFAAPPYWLELLPLGWLIGALFGRVRLTFWQIELSGRESAPYAGMLSARDQSIGTRSREIAQGRRLETTDRVFGHRAVTSESAAFLDRYSLIVGDGADEVAVRDMFGPSYLVFLTEAATEDLFIELRGNVLSIGVRHLVLDAEDLNALEATARRTLQAVLDGAGAGLQAD